MGLKTTNYEIKELGITLPEAYAILKKLRIDKNEAIAKLAVQSTREKALALAPIYTESIRFTIDRNENPYVTAYRLAKGQREMEGYNPESMRYEPMLVNMPFYGWEDDVETDKQERTGNE